MNDFFLPEVKQKLLDAGFPLEMIEYLQRWNGCCAAINPSSNPVKAARSIMIRPTHVKFYKSFVAARAKEIADQAELDKLINHTNEVRNNGGEDE